MADRTLEPAPKRPRTEEDRWLFHASLPSGWCKTVSVLRSGTVRDLKKAVQQSLGRTFLRLAASAGRPMDDPMESLELAGLKDGDAISVVAQQPKVAATGRAFALWSGAGQTVTWGDSDAGGDCSRVQDHLRNVSQRAASQQKTQQAALATLDALAQREGMEDSLLCVGLDPHKSELQEDSAEGAFRFCQRLIEETEHGLIMGIETLIVLDAKRGDIGSTSEAYATSAFETLRCDSITASPYLGSQDLQALQLPSGDPLLLGPDRGAAVGGPRCGGYLHVAKLCCGTWAKEHQNAGLVVGATDVEAMEKIRAAAIPDPSLRSALEDWQGSPVEGASKRMNAHVQELRTIMKSAAAQQPISAAARAKAKGS
eukprot:Skav218766  [mRNA]  locus=scaffold1372:238187:253819:- [translate_table: standard]